MFGQTFSLIDIPRLITLIFLEGVLSLDNALALATLVRGLHPSQRKKALFIGSISAFVLRTCVILLAAYLIHLFWLQLIGGLYLVYLAIRHLFFSKPKGSKYSTPKHFFNTVLLIEGTDLLFAIDSILAGLALIGITFHPPQLPPKLWIIYVGGAVGLIGMRFAAHFLSTLIDTFPRLEKSAHLIVGWIGGKLMVEAGLKMVKGEKFLGLPFWGELIFWGGIIAFFLSAFSSKNSPQKR